MSNLTDKELIEECRKRFISTNIFIDRDDMEWIVEEDAEKEVSIELFEEFKEYIYENEENGIFLDMLWDYVSPEMRKFWIKFKEYKKK